MWSNKKRGNGIIPIIWIHQTKKSIMQKNIVSLHIYKSNYNFLEVNVNYQWKSLPWNTSKLLRRWEILIHNIHFMHTLEIQQSGCTWNKSSYDDFKPKFNGLLHHKSKLTNCLGGYRWLYKAIYICICSLFYEKLFINV